MPESHSRKKPQSSQERPRTVIADDKPNPTWYVPVMVGLLIAGLVWVVITYILDSRYPIPGLGTWNLAVGFGLMLVGFGMTMRWK